MKRKIITIIIACSILFFNCSNNYSPRPRGFFRIDFPEKEYILFDSTCPYKFEIPVYAFVEKDMSTKDENCWINIVFPAYNAKIYISYIPVDKNFGKLLEDTYNLAYKHSQKADGINNILINIPENKVYGIFYDIKGNVASSKQFYLTDSVNHYLRGALYFNERPNKDSLAPVIDFIARDIDRFINSFQWKDVTKTGINYF